MMYPYTPKDFGLGAGLVNAFHVLRCTLRGSGRSTRQFTTLAERDVLIFPNAILTRQFEQAMRSTGRKARFIVTDPREGLYYAKAKAEAQYGTLCRPVLSHDWIEQFYEHVVRHAVDEVENF